MALQCCTRCAKDKPLEDFQSDRGPVVTCADCRRKHKAHKLACRVRQRSQALGSSPSHHIRTPVHGLDFHFEPPASLNQKPDETDGKPARAAFGIMQTNNDAQSRRAAAAAVGAQRRAKQGVALLQHFGDGDKAEESDRGDDLGGEGSGDGGSRY
ncbi:hypothetical protein LTS10_006923 [Elasticomyces elasticus]|nr:hypothetical protein LTS10_006923 [Elasticomyces elasticus]